MTLALSRRATRFAVKAADVAADGTFTGYGSVFGNVDSGGDMIVKGAFAASLAAHKAAGTRPKLLWQHDTCAPVGTWLELAEDDTGLVCRGRLLIDDVEKAREAYALMKAGELDGLSIGYDCTEWEHCAGDDMKYREAYPTMGGMPMAGQVRILKTINLWEISLVTFPMNEAARVETVKTARPAVLDLAAISAALDRREQRLGRMTRG